MITSKPPSWMSARMTSSQKADQCGAVSTTASPVACSAEAAVNSAVTSGDRLADSAATGSGSVPTSRADPNAATATRVGCVNWANSRRHALRERLPGCHEAPPYGLSPRAVPWQWFNSPSRR